MRELYEGGESIKSSISSFSSVDSSELDGKFPKLKVPNAGNPVVRHKKLPLKFI